jgi:hypothetical protein
MQGLLNIPNVPDNSDVVFFILGEFVIIVIWIVIEWIGKGK